MVKHKKPLPIVDNDTLPFWDGCKKGKLLIQQCQACEKHIFYPRIICPNCMSDEIKWIEASGNAKVYSFTIARRSAGPAFKDDVPYVVALVELTEGVRMLTNIVNCEPESIHCEMQVELIFEEREDFSIPLFQPLNKF